MKLIDITRPLANGMPIWPGDTEYSFQLNWTIEQSGSVNVGKITMSPHTGTHIDAPFHYDNEGAKVHELDIHLYVGKVRVIELSGLESIGRKDLESFNLDGISRLIIKTNSWKGQHEFPKDFSYIQPDAAPYLAEKGIRLIGLDSPSVDQLESKEIPGHLALLKAEIHILEGALLDEVEPGDYTLIALPLKIQDGDGSPVRAVLQPIE